MAGAPNRCQDVGMTHYQQPSATDRVMNRAVGALTRMGVSVWGSRVLRVRGRSSGEWRSTPVNVLTLNGRRYLVSPRGRTQWVRNLRAAGTGQLVLGKKVEDFSAREVTDDDQGDDDGDDKIQILRAYLRRWKFEVGRFFGGVSAESSDEDLRRIAVDHPVFRISSTGQ